MDTTKYNTLEEIDVSIELAVEGDSAVNKLDLIPEDDRYLSYDIIKELGGEEKKNNYMKQLMQVISRLVKCTTQLFSYDNFLALLRAIIYKAEQFREIIGKLRAALVKAAVSTFLYLRVAAEQRRRIIENINNTITYIINKIVEEMNEILTLLSCCSYKKQLPPSVLPEITTLDCSTELTVS